jgi:hypothetical protein|tara:strand:- start:104 stop:649 length:546 start_codon:yes stop_codon:yes gene_type:complete
MLKTFLTIIVSTLLLTNLTGCANGNTKDPLKPVGVKSQTDKKLSTVVFYRSDDSFGSLDFGEITAKVDDVSAGIMSEDSNPNFYLEASRSEYMSNTYMPGIHTFSLGPLWVQTVDLEAGKTYYLAVAFYPGGYLIDGTRGLEFRTKENFLKSTTTASQIEYTGEKCSQWSGCPKQVVNLLN